MIDNRILAQRVLQKKGCTMKFLFFDMEFANGQVAGSVYSLGYLVTDEEFEILVPPTDLLINPDCVWNEYVEQNILAYPKEEVEAAPKFSDCYEQLKALFAEADVAVGFAVSNDTRALRKACERYGLEPIVFRYFDTEKLCRKMTEHKEAHGLGGLVKAWCGEEPENRHRSDGDALATMQLLRAVCKAKHATPEMMLLAYPECAGDTAQKPQKPRRASQKRADAPKKRRRRHSLARSSKPPISE